MEHVGEPDGWWSALGRGCRFDGAGRGTVRPFVGAHSTARRMNTPAERFRGFTGHALVASCRRSVRRPSALLRERPAAHEHIGDL